MHNFTIFFLLVFPFVALWHYSFHFHSICLSFFLPFFFFFLSICIPTDFLFFFFLRSQFPFFLAREFGMFLSYFLFLLHFPRPISIYSPLSYLLPSLLFSDGFIPRIFTQYPSFLIIFLPLPFPSSLLPSALPLYYFLLSSYTSIPPSSLLLSLPLLTHYLSSPSLSFPSLFPPLT